MKPTGELASWTFARFPAPALRQRFVAGLRSQPGWHGFSDELAAADSLQRLVCGLRSCPALHGVNDEVVTSDLQRFVSGFRYWSGLHEVCDEAETASRQRSVSVLRYWPAGQGAPVVNTFMAFGVGVYVA